MVRAKGSKPEESRELAVCTRPIGPWTFTMELPAYPSRHGIAFDSDDCIRMEYQIARWLIDHVAISRETLRFLRSTAGLKAKELAELVGVVPDTVTRWEKGDQNFDRLTWELVARMADEKLRGSTETLDRLRKPSYAGPMTIHLEPDEGTAP